MTEPIGAPSLGDQPTTSALTTVTGRIFLLDNSRFVQQVLPFLAPDRSGLVVGGKGSNAKASTLWRQSTSPLLVSPAAYLDQVATAEEPFALPDSEGALFGTILTRCYRDNANVAPPWPSRRLVTSRQETRPPSRHWSATPRRSTATTSSSRSRWPCPG
jgi:hypothetical protein